MDQMPPWTNDQLQDIWATKKTTKNNSQAQGPQFFVVPISKKYATWMEKNLLYSNSSLLGTKIFSQWLNYWNSHLDYLFWNQKLPPPPPPFLGKKFSSQPVWRILLQPLCDLKRFFRSCDESRHGCFFNHHLIGWRNFPPNHFRDKHFFSSFFTIW